MTLTSHVSSTRPRNVSAWVARGRSFALGGPSSQTGQSTFGAVKALLRVKVFSFAVEQETELLEDRSSEQLVRRGGVE